MCCLRPYCMACVPIVDKEMHGGEYELFFVLILGFMPAIIMEAQVDGRGPRR